MYLSTESLIYGGGFAAGAKTLTAGKPKLDGSIDHKDASFPRKIREQITWLNVNEADIPAIVSSITTKTIGVSISIQVESPYENFNQQAERYIERFCGFSMVNGTEESNCDITGKHHFVAMARVMSDFTVLHGGFLLRHHYNTKWDIPYRVEMIGVDMIDISKTTRVMDGAMGKDTTLNGLVRDAFGRITHVWIYTNATKLRSVKVPYSELTYHSDTWVSIDQQVAISKLTSILSKLDDASQYGTAELQAAIEEAKAGHYIKSTAYNELMKIVADEVAKATAGVSSKERIGQAKDLITPILRDLSNLGVKARGTTPIPSDDDVIFNTSKRASIYKDMTSNAEMKISAAQGMSDIGVYSKAADANFSSIKYTLETDQRTADIRFNDLSHKVFFGIFARVIRVGIQVGEISGRADYWKNESKYLKFRYLRQNKIDTEPSKNAIANKTNIALGVDTQGQIVERTQGVKYEAFLASRHAEKLLEIDYEVKLEIARRQAYEKAGIMVTEEPKTQGATQ